MTTYLFSTVAVYQAIDKNADFNIGSESLYLVKAYEGRTNHLDLTPTSLPTLSFSTELSSWRQ